MNSWKRTLLNAICVIEMKFNIVYNSEKINK